MTESIDSRAFPVLLCSVDVSRGLGVLLKVDSLCCRSCCGLCFGVCESAKEEVSQYY